MKTYTVPEHTVTEIEKEDWNGLNHMTVTEAVDFLEGYDDLENYTGGYDYGSTDPIEFYKAKMLCAYNKVLTFARMSCYREKGGVE